MKNNSNINYRHEVYNLLKEDLYAVIALYNFDYSNLVMIDSSSTLKTLGIDLNDMTYGEWAEILGEKFMAHHSNNISTILSDYNLGKEDTDIITRFYIFLNNLCKEYRDHNKMQLQFDNESFKQWAQSKAASIEKDGLERNKKLDVAESVEELSTRNQAYRNSFTNNIDFIKPRIENTKFYKQAKDFRDKLNDTLLNSVFFTLYDSKNGVQAELENTEVYFEVDFSEDDITSYALNKKLHKELDSKTYTDISQAYDDMVLIYKLFF